MTLLARGFDDVLLDNLVTLGTAYSAAQVGLGGAGVAFKIERDRMAAPNDDELAIGPIVNCYASALNPSASGSSRDQENATVTVNFDLYVALLAQAAIGDGGDKMAMARLYYLKEQVKAFCFGKSNYDLGFTPGVVGRHHWGRFSLQPQDQNSELWLCAATWSMDVDYSYSPDDIPLTQLTTVSVNVDKANGGPTAPYKTAWAGLYTVHA